MFVMDIKCTELDGSKGSVLIHHLIIKCYLGLMCLRLSILLLVIGMDGLQYGRAFYCYPSAAPFDPFVVISLDEQRNMNGFDGPTAFVFRDFFSNHHKCDVTFSSDN